MRLHAHNIIIVSIHDIMIISDRAIAVRRVGSRRFQVRNPTYRSVQIQRRHVWMFDASGRRHVRSDGLVLGHGAADGGDLLVFVLLLVRIVGAVLEVRVGYGLRMVVHWSPGRGRRVDVARGRQRGPKRFWRYVDRVVQRGTLLWFRTEVRFVPTFLISQPDDYHQYNSTDQHHSEQACGQQHPPGVCLNNRSLLR